MCPVYFYVGLSQSSTCVTMKSDEMMKFEWASTFVPKVKLQLHKDHIFLSFCSVFLLFCSKSTCAAYVQYSVSLFKASSYELKVSFQ